MISLLAGTSPVNGYPLVNSVRSWFAIWLLNPHCGNLLVGGPVMRTGDDWQDDAMEIGPAVDFVRRHHRAVLATTRRDGTPQLSPVLATVDSAGRVVISSRETAIKTKNLRRDPRAWLCVFTDRFYGTWRQLTGTVDIVSLPDAMESLIEYYRNAVGEHPDWDEYREAMRHERRCLLRMTVTAAGPDVSG
jgi:PPOX class probable F420-dependent enzyme